MTRHPTTKSLRAFEALVRCGRLQKAADELHVTPGAVSQQIRALEQQLGSVLFDRQGRTMKPTVEACNLARDLSVGFCHIENAVDRYFAAKGTEALSVATLPSVSARIVLPSLHEFRSLCPNAQLSFSYIHRLDDVEKCEADVLVCALDEGYSGTGTAHWLFSGAAQPFASPAYVKQFGPFESPSDIARAALLHDFSVEPWRAWFKNVGVKIEDQIAGDVFEDFDMLIHAVHADQGIALCPIALIGQELEDKKLLSVSTQCANDIRGYYVLLQKNAKPVAVEFKDWLVRATSALR